MNCVLATTRAIAASTSGWMRWYCARRSTIGTLMAPSSLPSARGSDQAAADDRHRLAGVELAAAFVHDQHDSAEVARQRQRSAKGGLARELRLGDWRLRGGKPHAAVAVVASREEGEKARARPTAVGLERQLERSGAAFRCKHDELRPAFAQDEAGLSRRSRDSRGV